jgi:hypothetical protein
MFAILKTMFGAPSVKAAARFRPTLEALEGRDVPSAVGYAMTVQGSKDFLVAGGALFERDDAGNVTNLTPGSRSVTSVSVHQDLWGPAKADVLFSNGDLWRWDDSVGWRYMTSFVSQVSAGPSGYSAVLLRDGRAGEMYADPWWTSSLTVITSNVSGVSMGTDRNGQPMIDVLWSDGSACEWRGYGNWESLGSGIRQVAAGENGASAVLFNNGDAYNHYDAAYAANGHFNGSGWWQFLSSNVTWVSIGTDFLGYTMTDVIYHGAALQHSDRTGWTTLTNYAAEVDAGPYGVSIAFGPGRLGGYYITRFQDWSYLAPVSSTSLDYSGPITMLTSTSFDANYPYYW